MKVTFRGWQREVHTHCHDVRAVSEKNEKFFLSKEGSPVAWQDSKTAHEKVSGLSLSGDFLVRFEFKDKELKNWLEQYVKDSPEKAIKLLAAMQAEALIQMVEQKGAAESDG